MKISIIVPVFNSIEYIKRCFDSINEQNCDCFEVIVVDDGSTDGSEKFVEEYCFSKNKKKIIHKTNTGLLSAWIDGVKSSTGEYIMFVDSDDYIDKAMINRFVEKIDTYRPDLIMCKTANVDIKNNVSQQKSLIGEGIYTGDNYSMILENIVPSLDNKYISPSRCNKAVKRDIIFKSIDSMNLSVSSGEDNYATSKWFIDSRSLYYIDEPLYFYCYNANSISHTFKDDLLQTYVDFVSDLIEYDKLRNSPISIEKFRSMYNFYGFLWCVYVFKSNKTFFKKSKEMKKICRYDQFKIALEPLTKRHFLRNFAYWMIVKMKTALVMIIAMKISNKY